MNTKLIIIIAVLVVAVVGSYYFMGNRMTATTSENGYRTMQGSNEATYGDFASRLESGNPIECQMSYESQNDAGNGTLFIAEDAESFRFDLNLTKSAAGAMTTHVIGHEGFMYSWKEGDTQGMKLEMVGSPRDSMLSSTGGAFMDQNMDISCGSWRVDNSRFTPPSSVSFMEFRAQY